MGLGRSDIAVPNQLANDDVVAQTFAMCYGGGFEGGGSMILGDLPGDWPQLQCVSCLQTLKPETLTP
jgi:hypothetical protein